MLTVMDEIGADEERIVKDGARLDSLLQWTWMHVSWSGIRVS